jgi:cysteinyl-tRNA synthetase
VPFVLSGRPLPLLDPTRVYVCGITPYAVTHLGHASTFVWTDLLTRILRDGGVTPILTRNVTDVDDVLTAAAQQAGETHPDRFAYLQQYDFDRDMAALRVRRPDHQPRARHHVAGVIRLAQVLLEQGRAYEAGGSVYYLGAGVAERAGLADDQALSLAADYGGRVDDPAKRHPLDVALWQASTADEPSWPSPWGDGRPGWHAECAAMALATYGPAVDIHAGGADLTFPHHAYEAAIAESVTGVEPFARRWMRVGVVRIGGAKMAKSTGNLVLVDDLLAEHPPAVLRLLLLDRAWDADWDYTPAALDAAGRRLDALQVAAGRPGDDYAADRAVRQALRNDLDVPRALDVAVEAGGRAAARLTTLLALD